MLLAALSTDVLLSTGPRSSKTSAASGLETGGLGVLVFVVVAAAGGGGGGGEVFLVAIIGLEAVAIGLVIGLMMALGMAVV